ncbi:hypothetical protein BJ742DRAFT_791389 [Cladochytrium replicatum]|nr:hypothetical protein BJ742DRAFT_791389 [Cladochytrium replicatum]
MGKRRKPQQKLEDGPPTQYSSLNDAEKFKDMPKRARWTLQMMDRASKVRSQTAKPPAIQKKPTESLKQFESRVENEIRAAVNQAVAVTTKTQQKRKEWLKERKKKLKTKITRTKNEDERKYDKVGLHEVVQEPPKLTAGPRKSAKHALAKSAPVVEDSPDSDQHDDEPNEAEESSTATESVATKRKVKLKNLGLAERKGLLAEREKMIELYRAKKAERERGKADVR